MIDAGRIGRAIRTLRIKAGYTQKELAEKLFLSDVAVSKWERGKSVPDTETLMKLAILLDMDVDGLLDGTATYSGGRWLGTLLLDGSGLRADTLLWDKPLIDYQLSYFLLAGIRELLIACPEDQKEYIHSRFRGGDAIGARLNFALPEALTVETPAWERTGDVMFASEPFFLYGVNLTRFLQRAMQQGSPVVELASVVGRSGVPLKEGFSNYTYRPLPLFFVQGSFLAKCDADTPLREVPRLAETHQCLRTEPMDKGFLFSPLRDAENAEMVVPIVHGIQDLGGYTICCPLEVAWRRGMMHRHQLLKEAARFPEYRDYLSSLLS